MTTTQKLVTAEEFQRFAESHDGRSELVRGEVRTMPPIGFDHWHRTRRVFKPLDDFVEAHGLGEVMIDVGYVTAREPDTVRGPDVAFLRSELAPGEYHRPFIEGIPDLAVEITDATRGDSELAEKVAEYLAAGVGRVWVLWMNSRTVTVFLPDGSVREYGPTDTLSSDDAGFEVEGLALGVEDIFPPEA
jgi:Uma2 family endonuclease